MRQPIVHAQEKSSPVGGASPLDLPQAWQLLRTLADHARAGTPLCVRTSFALDEAGWREATASEGTVSIGPEGAEVTVHGPANEDTRALLALFAPLVVGPRASTLVVGHLGQSLDGRVATPTGASQFITGREDVVHTHRLRALFDAVIVGVRTVQLDDPQLTTRLVPGKHPTRVILDPHAKLDGGYKVIEDGATPTLVCTSDTRLPTARKRGCVEWLGLRCCGGRFDPAELLQSLRQRGLARVFIEGGGVTVSHFLAARALDRLHIGVAPIILGSGAPAFALPPIDRLDEALSLRCRHFSLGSDVLFDCELTPAASFSE